MVISQDLLILVIQYMQMKVLFEKSQSMTFYYNGEEVMVNYDLDVTAHIMEDAGDYWNLLLLRQLLMVSK
jgi:hypothetical protein